jgi:hypothetical protein
LQAYSAALAGAAVFSVAAFVLHVVGYGAQQQFDGLVRFTAPGGGETAQAIAGILRATTRHHALVTLREVAQADLLEHAYQVRIPDDESRISLVTSLEALSGVHDVILHMQEPTLEL